MYTGVGSGGGGGCGGGRGVKGGIYNTDKQFFGIFHIPINYLVDNFNKLTQMAVIKITIYPNTTRLYWFFTEAT